VTDAEIAMSAVDAAFIEWAHGRAWQLPDVTRPDLDAYAAVLALPETGLRILRFALHGLFTLAPHMPASAVPTVAVYMRDDHAWLTHGVSARTLHDPRAATLHATRQGVHALGEIDMYICVSLADVHALRVVCMKTANIPALHVYFGHVNGVYTLLSMEPAEESTYVTNPSIIGEA
jgi:hypothetical protein